MLIFLCICEPSVLKLLCYNYIVVLPSSYFWCLEELVFYIIAHC